MAKCLFGPLCLDNMGNLYGITSGGGAYGSGTVFKIDVLGNFSVFHNFTYAEDASSLNGIIDDSEGNLYGTTQRAGTYGIGSVFKLDTSNNFSILHSFSYYVNLDGADPFASVTRDSEGNLFGTTTSGGMFGSGTVFKVDTQGNFSLLHSFNGNDSSDGADPFASVTPDSHGNLFGTTTSGGMFGFGTVFKIDAQGNFSLLHSFNNDDGSSPYSAVILDNLGNLYGTTTVGGPNHSSGVVFKIDTLGNFSLLHTFTNNSSDGHYPNSLSMDHQGNLFGTAFSGGSYGDGTVFELDNLGNYSVLHNFNNSDGESPYSAVTIDSHGNLYGSTVFGGADDFGTVFKINNLHQFSLLHTFRHPRYIEGPSQGAVVVDSLGNLFGTTAGGGAYYDGTVYKIDTEGNFSNLHTFDGSDGGGPCDAVTLDSQGNLFGTTAGGGLYGNGTVYELTSHISNQTSSLEVVYHGYVHRPGSHAITQQITFTNTSENTLFGPFNLAISSLPSGITLNSATGTTVNFSPGSPFITVGGSSLAVGASISVTLTFNDPHLSHISYSPTFLAGNGTP